MKRLLFKSFLLLIPLLILLIIFVGFDPMKVFNNYQSPVTKGVVMNDRLFAVNYLKKTKMNYDSFIFGSSRSKAFKSWEWKKHINSNKIYHLGVNDESLYGLLGKLKFLESHGFQFKNALLIFDHRILSLTKNHQAHVFTETPEITGITKVEFYKKFLFAFMNPEFLIEYIKYTKTGVFDKTKAKLWDPGFRFVPESGDIIYHRMDSLIFQDSVNYYLKKQKIFYQRSKHEHSKPVIDSTGKQQLIAIAEILKQHKTNYQIIVTPNYDQRKLSETDLQVLISIFGKNHICDYSGVNTITNNIGNYYEEKHFKPYIANKLLKQSYSNANNY